MLAFMHTDSASQITVAAPHRACNDSPTDGPRPSPTSISESRTENERVALSVTEVAKLLGISRAPAYELAARGELPVLRLGGASGWRTRAPPPEVWLIQGSWLSGSMSRLDPRARRTIPAEPSSNARLVCCTRWEAAAEQGPLSSRALQARRLPSTT